MKNRNLNGGIILLFVLVILLAGAVTAGDRKGEVAGRVEPASRQLPVDFEKSEVIQKTKKLQMPFVANNGQVDERVKFYAKTFGGTVFVTKDGEIVYALPNNSSDVETQCLASLMHLPNGIQGNHVSDIIHPASWIVDYDKSEFQNPKSTSSDSKNLKSSNPKSAISNPQSKIRSVALKEEFVGARIKMIQGEEKSVTQVNYFKGNDPSKWKTNVSTYDMVNLGEIYKGIELSLKAYGDNVEKLFCVKPGANPEQIKISLSGIQPLKNPPPSSPSVRGTGGCPPLAGAGGGLGARGLCVNEEGQLVAETELGPVKFTKPIAYQEIDGKRVEVTVEYRIQKSGDGSQIQDAGSSGAGKYKIATLNPKPTYGFKVASYDRTRDLVIDPLLASTRLGMYGSYSLILDTSGNVYVTGYTYSSTDSPTTSGAYDTSFNGGYDVFVSKLDSGLTSLLASTYLGGSESDYGYSLALDTSGNVYVTGWTGSSNFPTTSGAYGTSKKGDNIIGDVFVSKLDSGLTSLLASTFLGGSDGDVGYSLALDTSGNVYVLGDTGSTDFPTTSGAYDISKNYNNSFWAENNFDVFVSKLDGGLTNLLASTYLGGSDDENYGRSLTLDTSGNVYVTGYTGATNFPTTTGAYDTSYNAVYYNHSYDVFVSKLDGGLGTLTASTYLGGSGDYGDDYGYALTLDTSGNVYVTGFTKSSDFPTTSGAYDTSYNGGDYGDVFVSKLDGGLTSLLASTYLGGSESDYGYSLALDTSGNVYVTGYAESTDFPTMSGSYDTTFNDYADVFVSKLDSGLMRLLASTYLGDTRDDYGYSLILDTSGNVYVTGHAGPYFPKTSGAYDTSDRGGAFVSKLDSDLSASTITPTPLPTSSPTPTVTTSPTPLPTLPPLATPTPPSLPTPSPQPTPEGCSASSITAFPFSLVINKSKTYKNAITVWVLGDGGCLVQNAKVKAKLDKAGRKVLTVKPSSRKTNQLGIATFSIKTKKKAGNATITFSTQGAGFSITTIASVVVTE